MNILGVMRTINTILPILDAILPENIYLDAAQEILATTQLSKAERKEALDTCFDRIEDAVVNSPGKLDDVTVLPMMRGLRRLLAVPDGDD